MDRVGGYASLYLLEQDARRFDDLTLSMMGDAEARTIANQRREIEAEKIGVVVDDDTLG